MSISDTSVKTLTCEAEHDTVTCATNMPVVCAGLITQEEDDIVTTNISNRYVNDEVNNRPAVEQSTVCTP